MTLRAATLGLFSVALASCTPTPSVDAAPTTAPAVRTASHAFTWTEIEPILVPLTYSELWLEKCDGYGVGVKTEFLADLKLAGASLELLEQANTEATRIETAERDTPNEYVCTVELFESTEKNAGAAQAAWTALKQHKS